MLFVVGAGLDGRQVDGGQVAAEVEVAGFVEDVREAAGHARAEVDAGWAKDHDFAARHVFAAVVTDTFRHQRYAGVADGETFARLSVEEDPSARCAVGDHIACDDVLLRAERCICRRTNGDDAAGKALADEVIGFAGERERHAGGEECAEGLSGYTVEVHGDRVVGEGAVACGDFAREFRADRPIGVVDTPLNEERRMGNGGIVQLGNEVMPVVGVEHVGVGAWGELRFVARLLDEEAGEVEACLALLILQKVGASDGLVERAEPESGEELARFLRKEAEEVDDVDGATGEELAPLGALGGNADRAGVAVAAAVLDAAEGDQERRAEPEFLGAEKGADHDVASGLELSVDLDLHAPAQSVLDEGLLGLGESELPREAGMLHRSERCGAGAAVEAGDEDDVGVGLGDARGDRTDTGFGDELDADASLGVGAAEIVNELREILDRVDVVMGRRRDERCPRPGVAKLGDELVHLVRGELAALAGLCALGELDLQVPGVPEVVERHAEASGGDLLDAAVRVRAEALGVEPAFAGVRH